MLRSKMPSVFALALLGATVAARPAHALVDVCNTATGNYNNSAAAVQPAVNGSTCFTAQSNPILVIDKTRSPGNGAPGTNVTFDIRVTYPKLVPPAVPVTDPGVCGDDSTATSVVITDPVSVADFTYVPGSLLLSTDNGTSFVAKSDAADADELSYSLITNILTGNLGTLTEGTGGAGCTPGAARIIRFQVTKN